MQETSEETNQETQSPELQEQALSRENETIVGSVRFLERHWRRKHESQTAYLELSRRLIIMCLERNRPFGFDPYRLDETQLTPAETAFIAKLTSEARRLEMEAGTPSDQEYALTALSMSIRTHFLPGFAYNTKLTESNFEKTTRNRMFFKLQPDAGPAKRECYWSTLFYPVNTEATQALAKELIQNKIVVVLGGGHARLTEELKQHDITPGALINVEPFVSSPKPGADPVLPMSAADPELIHALQQQGIERADEIWAEFSVPTYLVNPDEIGQLFQNIDTLLADGGTARIWPTEVLGSGTEADELARRTALFESVRALVSTGRYELVPYEAAGLPGFSLHKIGKEA